VFLVLAALLSTPFCARPIDHATWSDEPRGARIVVVPSGCGRRSSWLAPEAAFRAALAAGGRVPDNRRSLFLQFRCHTLFASAKRSWNLETWRPAVSSRRMIAALCNPSGRAPPVGESLSAAPGR
jgi:hypothetical protein